MAKKKPITEIEKVEEVKAEPKPIPVKDEDITVIGIVQAEKYQKSGWQLLDCQLTSEGKQYKFRKAKE